MSPARAESPAASLGPVGMGSYSQTIRLTFKSETSAGQAQVHLAALYHDLRAAFSTRMDDCNLNDLRVAEVMAQHGQKGTFLLNDPAGWWQDSPETGITAPDDPARTIPRQLLKGGNSIGGHTLNHEMLPALSKNAAFREILGDRVALETRSASPNIAFVFPFVFFKSELRDGTDRADLDEMLRRSGYYDLVEDRYNEDWASGMLDGRFVTLDGNPAVERRGEALLAQNWPANERPLFLVTMHAWVNKWAGPQYPKLAETYRKWSGRQDWWYCNSNQYAAYRYQFLHSRMTTFVEGKILKIILTRPDPLDLGDDTPLTFRVDGVPRDEVVSVTGAHADVQAITLDGTYAFDLFHDRSRGPVEVYAESANPTNADQIGGVASGTAGLQARLHHNEHTLGLLLHNESAQTLRDLRVTFRLPLRWEQGVIRQHVENLPAGTSITLEIPLVERPDANHYADGPEYDVAQIDFLGQRRARLYATCEVTGSEPAPSFARNGFWILGPLPGDVAGFDPAALVKSFLSGQPPDPHYSISQGEILAWKTLAPGKASLLDPDIVPTTGKPNIPLNYRGDPALYSAHTKIHYVLYGRVVSPDERVVTAIFDKQCVQWLSVNGEKVESDQLKLKQGINDVRILYLPSRAVASSYEEANYGCYFRLLNADGQRMPDLRFERPPLP